MNINQWLDELKRAWEQHDIDAAVNLFSGDVEYWESPFDLIPPNSLGDLWQDILGCIDTTVESTVYSSTGGKHSVIWSAQWHDSKGAVQKRAGTYLVTLNDDGKCSYFYRTSMPEEAG